MVQNPVNWFEIYVQDLDRAKAFYEAMLQTELAPLPAGPEGQLSMLAFPADPANQGAGGALVHMPGMASGGNSILVYFSCEDCAVTEARIADAGGELVRAKMSIGEYGFVSLGTDPDGNMFGLHSLK
jgi:predicted enzyme related to lactoylglutathione lyase